MRFLVVLCLFWVSVAQVVVVEQSCPRFYQCLQCNTTACLSCRPPYTPYGGVCFNSAPLPAVYLTMLLAAILWL